MGSKRQLIRGPGGMSLLPAKAGDCQVCFVKHDPAWPHNAQSLSYRVRFMMLHGRSPTWADAVAHCAPAMRAAWGAGLKDRDAWSEVPEPIAEPVGADGYPLEVPRG